MLNTLKDFKKIVDKNNEVQKKWQTSTLLDQSQKSKTDAIKYHVQAFESLNSTLNSNSSSSNAGSSYTSPLNEFSRTYATNDIYYVDTTGLFIYIVKPLKSITFKDSSATQQSITFNLNV